MQVVRSEAHFAEPPLEPVIAFHLLSLVDFDDAVALQNRLAFEAGDRADGRIEVLLGEHPEMITVGQAGSRRHIRLSQVELSRRRLEVRWVSRGGGCVLHSPGQLFVYPIVPLEPFGWTECDYVARLANACRATFAELSLPVETYRGTSGLWGRTGKLAEIGVSLRHKVVTDGLFINVNPTSTAAGYLDSASAESLPEGVKPAWGSLLAERRLPVKMTTVRATLIPQLAAAFGCERYFMHTGHPHLRPSAKVCRESSARRA